jgi:hypothetical protein
MTEIASPVFPPGRYGRRREPRRTRRWLPYALVIPVLIMGLFLAAHLYGQYGNGPYQGSIQSTSQVTASSVTVTLAVHKDSGGTAICGVQAKDRSGAEVGYADVPVPAGKDVTVNYQLKTTSAAFAVELTTCRAGS